MENAKILRLPAVIERVGVSRPTIYLWIKKGAFPAQLKIGPNASGWLAAEVDAWIAERATARAANWDGRA
jgi:prophage regulatory protein